MLSCVARVTILEWLVLNRIEFVRRFNRIKILNGKFVMILWIFVGFGKKHRLRLRLCKRTQ